jgi:DUF4097 and DUF4098 domain-containing protein YvlB
MKKTSIILIIIGLILIVASVVIAQTNGTNLMDFWRESSQSNYIKQEKLINADGVNMLTVRSSNDRIKVLPTGPNEQIKVEYYIKDEVDFNIEVKKGELLIEKQEESILQWLDFDFWSDRAVIVHIPEGMKLRYILDTNNGTIELENLAGTELNVTTGNGVVSLTDLNIDDSISTRTSNGKIELTNVTAVSLDVSTSNGLIAFNNVNAKTVKSRTSNGKIEFDRLRSDNIDATTSNGLIGGSIVGSINDFSQDLSTSNGEVSINGEEYGKKVRLGNGEKQLRIRTSNGAIKINFVAAE